MLGRTNKSQLKSPMVVPFDECPAKTYESEKGTTQGRSVLNHCQIVGEVARELIRRFPTEMKEVLFPPYAFLAAATHDVGKVSPCFVEKIRRACNPKMNATDPLPNINPELERQWGGHAGVSQLTATAMDAPRHIPEILGQHHGFSPPVNGLRANDENFGGTGWQQEREALVNELKRRLDADWPVVSSVPQARLVAGLTSVSDWIGSGEFFEDPSIPWEENISRAIDKAGFIPPSYQSGLGFEQVFPFPAREAQQQLINQVEGAGVYVLEAPMGMGKTEAALYAAYKLLGAGQATGVYFALPTQLTSNKIFERFNEFLDSILTSDCHHRSLLLHSNAWILETDMGEEGKPGGAWFNSAKRGLLAPFAVGTIDQALMAAMNVKHGFVRAFGLAGKVVILDEVHTYDAYTGTLLDALVSLLRSLHCTVIILTATLNHSRREKLLGCDLQCDAYPLITSLQEGKPVSEVAVAAEPGQRVSIKLLENEVLAVDEALKRAEQGQQVLWIENTVVDAQERYLDLAARAAEIGIATGLLHSRYTPDDRQSIEDKWISQFGKIGWKKRGEQGRILVGTQVLEQSLDIDADFMVSRFAPTDMLLQRFGRLWRHKETPRNQAACCEAWLLAPIIEKALESPEIEFGNSGFVYSPYVLCRSLEVWQLLESVRLPEDIRNLIENTYEARSETGKMSALLEELDHGTRWRKGRLDMQQLARITLAEAGNTLPESKAQTRYSESDNFDVLLVRQLVQVPEEKITRITLLNGVECHLPRNRNASGMSRAEWRQLTATLMRQVVAARPQDAPNAVSMDLLKRFYLHHCFYLGNPDWAQDESVLRVALVDETGRLKGLHGVPVHDRHQLEYRADLGYRVIKSERV